MVHTYRIVFVLFRVIFIYEEYRPHIFPSVRKYRVCYAFHVGESNAFTRGSHVTRPLHVLKLALPGVVVSSVVKAGTAGYRMNHTWPCGCHAGGDDNEALAVNCCIAHFRLLAGAQSWDNNSNIA